MGEEGISLERSGLGLRELSVIVGRGMGWFSLSRKFDV
jgi:hypothetical protein